MESLLVGYALILPISQLLLRSFVSSSQYEQILSILFTNGLTNEQLSEYFSLLSPTQRQLALWTSRILPTEPLEWLQSISHSISYAGLVICAYHMTTSRSRVHLAPAIVSLTLSAVSAESSKMVISRMLDESLLSFISLTAIAWLQISLCLLSFVLAFIIYPNVKLKLPVGLRFSSASYEDIRLPISNDPSIVSPRRSSMISTITSESARTIKIRVYFPVALKPTDIVENFSYSTSEDSNHLSNVLANKYGGPANLLRYLADTPTPFVKSSSIADMIPSTNYQYGFPVVIMSQNEDVPMFRSVCGALAMDGNIVISVQHYSKELDAKVVDIQHVLDTLSAVEYGQSGAPDSPLFHALKGRLVLDNVTVMGHGSGGAVSLSCASLDNRIRACVAIDVSKDLVDDDILGDGLPCPTLLIQSRDQCAPYRQMISATRGGILMRMEGFSSDCLFDMTLSRSMRLSVLNKLAGLKVASFPNKDPAHVLHEYISTFIKQIFSARMQLKSRLTASRSQTPSSRVSFYQTPGSRSGFYQPSSSRIGFSQSPASRAGYSVSPKSQNIFMTSFAHNSIDGEEAEMAQKLQQEDFNDQLAAKALFGGTSAYRNVSVERMGWS